MERRLAREARRLERPRFRVFPHESSSPIELPYSAGTAGVTCEHGALVEALRAVFAGIHVSLLETGVRVTRSRPAVFPYTLDGGPEIPIEPTSSSAQTVVRRGSKSQGLPDAGSPSLPWPAFCSRTSSCRSRASATSCWGPGPACCTPRAPAGSRLLRCAPVVLAASGKDRRRSGKPTGGSARCAAARPFAARSRTVRSPGRRISPSPGGIRPRGARARRRRRRPFPSSDRGGLTLGFQDAQSIAESASVAAYAQERSDRSRVAEVLATALYRAFTLGGDGSDAVRVAIYQLWREDAAKRERTMGFLSAEETDPASFAECSGRSCRGLFTGSRARAAGPSRRESSRSFRLARVACGRRASPLSWNAR